MPDLDKLAEILSEETEMVTGATKKIYIEALKKLLHGGPRILPTLQLDTCKKTEEIVNDRPCAGFFYLGNPEKLEFCPYKTPTVFAGELLDSSVADIVCKFYLNTRKVPIKFDCYCCSNLNQTK